MTTHIMLDLETWGTLPGCDIRSIGAVVFDPFHQVVGGETNQTKFYIATENKLRYSSPQPNVVDQRKYPLTRDPETVKWWNDQSAEAQAAFANPVDLREACRLFGKWLRSVSPISDYYDIGEHDRKFPDDICLWANGPQFDVSILAEVYHAVGLPVPWHYRAPRDFRTITDAAGMTRDDYCNYGEAHNALHDAIAQAMTVCEAYKRLGLTR